MISFSSFLRINDHIQKYFLLPLSTLRFIPSIWRFELAQLRPVLNAIDRVLNAIDRVLNAID